VEYSVHQLRQDGTHGSWNEVHENRYFLIQEMNLLLHSSGFEPLQWLAGFDAEAQVDGSTWHVVVLARVANGDAR
jgi:hypothetical protein